MTEKIREYKKNTCKNRKLMNLHYSGNFINIALLISTRS